MTITGHNHFFVKHLLEWNRQQNTRQMPWKGEKDPYKIWLSEIILQQTRVDQGLEYYNRFIATFPDVHQLAAAPETTVFKLWEGLGYYTRCKNIIATAKFISQQLNGQFPDQYEAILQLKGIGPYTAAAIASFAFNLPHAVVDGNVFRVLARYFGIATATDSLQGKLQFTLLANELLDKQQPGIYNQALMDFGAVICKPQLPLCATCVLKNKCVAYTDDQVNQLPVKEKKIKKTTRWFYYLVVEYKNKLYVRKRAAKDIWENLYEFILIEDDKPVQPEKIAGLQKVKEIFKSVSFEIIQISPVYKQLLTHQTIQGQFIKVIIEKKLAVDDYKLFTAEEINTLPFPKFITAYLKDKNVSLNLF
ncbi:A/G-specific adenine glycosylase [Ferruginibacter paludis]|uniref:A/G-specific adenine glycosylase n=1 Tax=Ferruginibacter paludis TaxID=1310417 RepID=UPI0025B3BFE6|nr:A/G-specific adenine glycosylase [Ferruginibacter paludis]MDN3658487.1 A/G-specific adenine glycosylase [Ferruginibacter paludis]